jgi:D-alanine-D-alanine ligase
MNLIVLVGGLSAERNVSLSTGRAIAKGLRESGHNVKVIDPVYGKEQPDEEKIYESHPEIGRDFPSNKELQNYSNLKVIECFSSSLFDNTDIVFIGLHGKFGEDGRIQSLLELRGVKYTGSGVLSSSMAMDKDVAKILFNHFNIPTPNWFTVEKDNYSAELINEKVKAYLKYPCVIKPNDEGSTVGLSIINRGSERKLPEAMKHAFSYSNKVIVEEYIEGRELTVGVLGTEALPVLEIKPKDGFYDYEHKYTKGMTEYLCPANIPAALANELQEQTLLAHNSLNCKAYSRIDYRLKPDGQYFCLEVNTLPGMTETSLVPKGAGAIGITFPVLLNRIIDLSLK